MSTSYQLLTTSASPVSRALSEVFLLYRIAESFQREGALGTRFLKCSILPFVNHKKYPLAHTHFASAYCRRRALVFLLRCKR